MPAAHIPTARDCSSMNILTAVACVGLCFALAACAHKPTDWAALRREREVNAPELICTVEAEDALVDDEWIAVVVRITPRVPGYPEAARVAGDIVIKLTYRPQPPFCVGALTLPGANALPYDTTGGMHVHLSAVHLLRVNGDGSYSVALGFRWPLGWKPEPDSVAGLSTSLLGNDDYVCLDVRRPLVPMRRVTSIDQECVLLGLSLDRLDH